MRRLLRGTFKLAVLGGVLGALVALARKLMGGLGPEPGAVDAPREWPSLVPEPATDPAMRNGAAEPAGGAAPAAATPEPTATPQDAATAAAAASVTEPAGSPTAPTSEGDQSDEAPVGEPSPGSPAADDTAVPVDPDGGTAG